jgi:hypothetical protein
MSAAKRSPSKKSVPKSDLPTTVRVQSVILTGRGQKVVLDKDLARIYGVETRVLNQAVKRNRGKFPEDFVFQLTTQEVTALRSHSVISKTGDQLQFASESKHGGRRYLPLAFTEHGALMAANVLRSQRAVEMSVFVVRAFVQMRQQLLTTRTLEKRLAEIEKTLLAHDTALVELFQMIRPLLLPAEEPTRRRIGFSRSEEDRWRMWKRRVAMNPYS